jgi:heptosyltransferase-2
MWHWKGYREVAQFLLTRGFPVVLLGGPSDEEVNAMVAQGLEVLNLAGKTSIAEAMYVIKNARLVVCNDSMVLHIASAFKVPNVAIFCATSPQLGFYPWKNKAVVVEKNLPCRPCSRHGRKTCPTGTEACMKELSHFEVMSATKRLLDIQ